MCYVICVAAAACLGTACAVFRKFIRQHAVIISKIFSCLIAAVFFVRYFSSSESVFQSVFKLTANNPYSSAFLCFVTALSVWLEIASAVIVVIYPFIKRTLFKNYIKTICLFSCLINIICLRWTVYSYTQSYTLSLCGVFLPIEVAFVTCACVLTIIADKGFKIEICALKDYFIFLPVILIYSAPPYIFGTFFGNFGQYLVTELNLYHRIYIYVAFLMLTGIYLLLRSRDLQFKRMILLYIALGTLISFLFDHDFTRFVTPTRWPLHLCNTAMFLIPLCLIFRIRPLYYFTLIINVVGAFIAMLMPSYDISYGVFSSITVRFWINHICAFTMPVLMVLLGIYDRPKRRQFVYSMIGFAMYFVLVLIVNAWFSNYGSTVDYFFINSDYVAAKLGTAAENTRNIVVNLKVGSLTLTFYPLYQALYFLGYVALGLASWFLYISLFQIQDIYLRAETVNRKIKAEEYAMCKKYNKSKIGECMNEQTRGKLVVNNLYKRYGKSKVDSVKDVSFVAEAGEILGFLGANGAGKSTTIKCIVGIHPITSGSIEVNGYDVEKQPVEAKMQIGFVPDHYSLYEKLTGREYINYVADLYHVPLEDRNERLTELLQKLNMADAIDNQIQTYSHGMKQKVAIMSALIHNPALWILDEPLTGLDPTSIYEVKECMKDHARKGNIVFFSSHLIDVVEKLCDRIIIIKNGVLIAETTLKELNDKNIELEQYYLDVINGADVEAQQASADGADGAEQSTAVAKEKKHPFKGLVNKIKKSRNKGSDDKNDTSDDTEEVTGDAGDK